MTHKGRLCFCLLLLLVAVSGCWDRRELESLGLVQALGLDLSPSGKGVTVTTLIAIPSKLGGQAGGGGGGEGPGTFVISMDAPSIYEAFNRMNTTINREITLLQNQTLIIGEEIARQGVSKWIDNLVRFREMRRTMNIIVAKGKAADILNVRPKLEQNPSEYLRDLINLSNRTGMFPSTDLNSFMDRYQALAQENYLPLIAAYQPKGQAGTGGNSGEGSSGGSGGKGGKEGEAGANASKAQDIRMIGTAIFKRDRMMGSFDIYETQALLLVTGEFKEAFMTIRDPKQKDYYIVFRLIAGNRPEIKYQSSGGVERFRVKLGLEADIVSIQSDIDYTQPKLEFFLGQKIAAELERRIRRVITKAQRQYNSDVFGFGIKVRNTVLTSTEWDHYGWPDKFDAAKIQVSAKVNIRRIGVHFHPPQNR
jgi:spore germination protein KC